MAWPVFALLIAIASIQLGASFAKHLFPLIGPESTTLLRVLFSAILLAAIFRPWRMRVSRKALGMLLLYGFSLGLMNLIFYLSIERIPLGIAVAIEFVGPLALALLASRRGIDFLWALMAAAGIYLVLPIAGLGGEIDLLGALYALIAGGFWALYIVFGKRAGLLVPGGVATSVGMIFAALAVAPSGLAHASPSWLEPRILGLAFGVAILSSALPYSLEMVALRKIPTRTFGIMMSLEPAFAALAGFVVLGESLSLVQWGAIASIIAASAGSSITARG